MAYAGLCVFTDTFVDTDAVASLQADSIAVGLNQLDISTVPGEYYVGFYAASDGPSASLEVSEVSLA